MIINHKLSKILLTNEKGAVMAVAGRIESSERGFFSIYHNLS